MRQPVDLSVERGQGIATGFPASVNSALQRARASLEARVPVRRERLSVPEADRELVVRFAEAFERDDIDSVVALLTEDAVVSMPPEPEWHQGRAAIDTFLRERHLARRGGSWRHALSRRRRTAVALRGARDALKPVQAGLDIGKPCGQR